MLGLSSLLSYKLYICHVLSHSDFFISLRLKTFPKKGILLLSLLINHNTIHSLLVVPVDLHFPNKSAFHIKMGRYIKIAWVPEAQIHFFKVFYQQRVVSFPLNLPSHDEYPPLLLLLTNQLISIHFFPDTSAYGSSIFTCIIHAIEKDIAAIKERQYFRPNQSCSDLISLLNICGHSAGIICILVKKAMFGEILDLQIKYLESKND